MATGVKDLQNEIQTKADGSLTNNEIALISGADAEFFKNVYHKVASTSLLPSASTNTGRLIYVEDTQLYYFSDGNEWTNDYTLQLPQPMPYAWGEGRDGKLGTNNTTNQSVPTAVYVTSGGPYSGVNWGPTGGEWVDIDNGVSTSDMSGAVKSDGTIWTWGYNASGQLGDNTTVNRSSPVQEISNDTTWNQISSVAYNMSAIKSDGTLWVWGSGSSGTIGDNTVITKSSPVQISGAGSTWSQVSGGGGHFVALKTDGTLWTWGGGFGGPLGDNTTDNRSSPVQISGGGTDWDKIGAGGSTSAAIKTDGTLWTWGNDGSGRLGHNTVSINTSSPVQVSGGGTDWDSISCGYGFMAITKTDGTLWTWGANDKGQLGDNTIVSKSSPIQEISSGTSWSHGDSGSKTTMFIKTDGTLWGIGANANAAFQDGSIGDGTNESRSSPVQEASQSTSWTKVSCGFAHSLGLK